MLEFIARIGYHFRRKIGRKSVEIAEIGGIRKHVSRKMADGVPSAENQRKMSRK